jgi:hypothetical protein
MKQNKRINVIFVKSYAHYIEAACSEQFNGYLFRGVPDFAEHPLVPSIGRLAKFQKASIADITKEEKYWLKRFRLEGARHVAGAPCLWEWIVLARHHELPVRLLDWSRSPLVALYFAVWDRSKKPAAVYAEKFTNHIDTEVVTDPFSVKKVAKFQPSHTSPRIAAQASILTIHPDPRRTYTSDTLVRFEISDKLAPSLKAHLRRCGFTPSTLFPDLDGLAKAIRYGED